MKDAFVAQTALDHAIGLFRYREEATGRRLPCDPNWQRVMRRSLEPALAGERGQTDQEQCVYQAIRIAEWQSGRVRAPWTKAFLPPSVAPPVAWYQRWWNKVRAWSQSFLKRFNDLV
jgi:hypothetical protein